MTTPTKPTKEATTPLPVLTEDKVRELRDLGYARICQPERDLVVALADHWLRTQQEWCEWVEIEEGTEIYNTCREGEEFHLTEGMELWPHCHWCGKKIVAIPCAAAVPPPPQEPA